MIEADGLTRRFGDVLAVDGASFRVDEGDVYGFLGPNGAGKTTTIRMLTGLIPPTRGTARVAGHDIRDEPLRAKARIGYMPEEPSFYEEMTAGDLVAYYGELQGMAADRAEVRARRTLDRVGLEDARDRKVEGFSHGMRKRTALAQALVHEPPLLILDEPTGGLDPAGTAWFRDLIRDLHDDGTTIFLSSHILPEVQQVCNRVGIIHRGKIIADDTPEALSKRLDTGGLRVHVTLGSPAPDAVGALESLDSVVDVRADGNTLHVELTDDGDSGRINKALVDVGADVQGLTTEQPDLEEIFLQLTED